MSEQVPDNPSGRALPQVGGDRYLVDRFLQGVILTPQEWKKLGENVINQLTREKFRPTESKERSLPKLEELAKQVGRVRILGEDVWTGVRKAYGSKRALRQRFFSEFGFATDPVEEVIVEHLVRVTGVSKNWQELKELLQSGDKFSFSSSSYHLIGRFMYVLDNIDGRRVAYGWPYLGVMSNRRIITPDLQMRMAYDFIQTGIRPWRIAHYQGGNDEIKNETVSVFIGK